MTTLFLHSVKYCKQGWARLWYTKGGWNSHKHWPHRQLDMHVYLLEHSVFCIIKNHSWHFNTDKRYLFHCTGIKQVFSVNNKHTTLNKELHNQGDKRRLKVALINNEKGCVLHTKSSLDLKSKPQPMICRKLITYHSQSMV